MVQPLPLVLLFGVTLSVPLVTFPINSQVPPVARVGDPYNFEFAARTFSSSINNDITYSLQEAPTWLSLDSASRTLSGTPSDGDTGPVKFQISAGDGDGSARMNVTIVVVNGPVVEAESASTVLDQLQQFGSVTGQDSISVYAGDSFNFPFGSGAFTSGSKQYYYATSGDRSPLPSWLIFNSASVSFSGVAPPQISYPQSFPVLVIASAIEGFAEATLSFQIVISEHQLVFKPFQQDVDVKQGNDVSLTNLRNDLLLDGLPISDSDFKSATADVPPWLKFDPASLAITGKPPSGEVSQNVSVQANDIFGNSAETIIQFRFSTSIFNMELGTIKVPVGRPFNYTFSRNLFKDGNYKISLDLGSASQWLHFDANSLTLSGTVPASTQPQTVEAKITASSGFTSTVESQTFALQIVPNTASPGPTVSTGVANGGIAVPTQGIYSSQGTGTPSQLGKGGLAAVIVIPILLAIILVVVLFFCCFRSGRSDQTGRPGGRRGPDIISKMREKTAKIGALLRRKPKREVDLEMRTAELMKGPREAVDSEIQGSAPPVPIRSPQRMLEDNIHGPNSLGLHPAYRNSSVLGGHIGNARYGSVAMPNHLSRRRTIATSARYKQNRSSASYRRSSGLPVERRLTGIGHGRPLSGVASGGVQKRSQGRSSRDYTSRSIETLNSLQKSFPGRPSLVRPKVGQRPTEQDKHKSIRVIDSRPFEEKRRSYIRGRASSASWSPLFAASVGPSRGLSISQARITDSVHVSPSKAQQVKVEAAQDSATHRSHSLELGTASRPDTGGSNWETSFSGSSISGGGLAKETGYRSEIELAQKRQTKKQNWSRKLSSQSSDGLQSKPGSAEHSGVKVDASTSSQSAKPKPRRREPLSSVHNESRPLSLIEGISKEGRPGTTRSSNSFSGNEAFM